LAITVRYLWGMHLPINQGTIFARVVEEPFQAPQGIERRPRARFDASNLTVTIDRAAAPPDPAEQAPERPTRRRLPPRSAGACLPLNRGLSRSRERPVFERQGNEAGRGHRWPCPSSRGSIHPAGAHCSFEFGHQNPGSFTAELAHEVLTRKQKAFLASLALGFVCLTGRLGCDGIRSRNRAPPENVLYKPRLPVGDGRRVVDLCLDPILKAAVLRFRIETTTDV
jgi:hypothetical protein